MKPKRKQLLLISVMVLIVALSMILSGCSDSSENRRVVYEDMKAAFEQANLLSSNIGIFTKIDSGASVFYGECFLMAAKAAAAIIAVIIMISIKGINDNSPVFGLT